MPRIVFKSDEHKPVDLHEPVTVGRSAQHSNVVIKDNRLSRAHCRFEPSDEGWSIVDLESQNGTFLNGRRVRSAMVKPGDVVTVGAVDMTIEEVDGPGGRTVMAGVQSTRAAGLDLVNDEDEVSPTLENKTDSTRTVVAPAALVLTKGTLTEKIHPITKDEFTFGRKHDNDLCLENDGKASGHHGRIRRDGLDYYIEDLGSTNGILVNGTKIDSPVKLKNGMKLVLGQQLFKFQLQGRPAESSGRTAPEMSSKEVQDRLSPPGQAGESDDLGDPTAEPAEENPPENATVAATPEEMAAVNVEEEAEDQSALSREVKFKGGGSAIFNLIEALVVIAIAGAILFAAWTMLKDNDQLGTDREGAFPPTRSGDLLADGNASFEDVDEGGFARGWSYITQGTDSVNLIEGAVGGQYAMQLSRFTRANQASWLVSTRMDVPGGGVKVSAFARNSEAAAGRNGTAVISIAWYSHPRDSSPMQLTPVVVKTGLSEWTEISGSAAPPTGAKAFSVALGLTGTRGAVAYDEVLVEAVDDAPDWYSEQSIDATDGMTWRISERGEYSLSGPDGVYLRDGRLLLHQADGRGDPLDVLAVLIGAPEFKRSDKAIYATFPYFDPIAEGGMKLIVELGAREGKGVISAVVQTDGGAVEDASRHVSLSGVLTQAWAPAEFVRFEKIDALPLQYRTEIGVSGESRTDIGVLLSSNTGIGNKIIAASDTKPRVQAQVALGGREVFVQNSGGVLELFFERGQDREELQERTTLLASVQPGEDQLDRVERALSIFHDFLFNQPEIATAATAMDAASKHYSLRLIELRDGINVPQLTRNEQLYRSAMQEAINSADRLNAASEKWSNSDLPMLRAAGGDGFNDRTREAADIARESLRELIVLAEEFENLADIARRSLFLLEIEIEQRESEPFLVSARDYLDSGQYVQGMVKLRAVVENYPRCLRGIEAKESMVDVAGILMDEMEEYASQDLKNISRDRATQARDLMDLVQKHLLVTLLSNVERQWLKSLNSPEMRPSAWVDREADLLRRMNDMRRKLPNDLPPREENE